MKIIRFINIIYKFLFPVLFFVLEMFVPKKKGLIIFSLPRGRLFQDNSRFLFEYSAKNKINNAYLLTKNKELFNYLLNLYPNRILYALSWKGLLTYLRSETVFITHGKYDIFPFYPIKHFKIFINLWHGTPIKRVNYLLKKNDKDYGSKVKFCKYLCTCSEFTKLLMATQFRLHIDNIWITGQPRNDALFASDQTLSEKYPFLNKKIVLYAPTFREKGYTNFFPFDDFNANTLIGFLDKQDIYILIRCHINEWTAFKEKIKKNLLTTNRIILADVELFPSVEKLLVYTDILITDYSSIYFDYLLLNRPIIFLPYDYKKYEKERGFGFDYDSNTPGRKPKTQHDFLSVLKNYLDNPDIDSDKRIEIRDKFNLYIDNDSSKRIFKKINKL